MNSSTAARLPLPHASSKNLRARALFFSSADTGASFPSLPTRFSLPGRHHAHDATRRPPAHRLEAYSHKCLEEEFCEVRGYKLPRPAPALYQSGRGRATFSPPPRPYCCICCENLVQAVATCYGLDFREFLHCPTPFP